MDDTITVTRDDDRGRYELQVGDALGGFTEFFVDATGRTVLPHTEIDPAFSGQGLGSTLAKRVLADLAAGGATVVPVCPFLHRYLEKHDFPGLTVDWSDNGADDARA